MSVTLSEPSSPAPLRVVLFGATGGAGSGVLDQCLADPAVTRINAITRRPLETGSRKVHEFLLDDFSDLSSVEAAFEGVDACLYCLGISASIVKQEDRYRVITYDYALAAARAVQKLCPDCAVHFISGGGTNPKSRMMWARVKGETELALQQLGLARLVCWRPGYIHAPRQLPNRPLSDRIMRRLYPLVRPFKSMSVPATDIGKAMLQATREGRNHGTIENRELREIATRYNA